MNIKQIKKLISDLEDTDTAITMVGNEDYSGVAMASGTLKNNIPASVTECVRNAALRDLNQRHETLIERLRAIGVDVEV